MSELKTMDHVHQESLHMLRNYGVRVGNTIEVMNTSMTLEDPESLEITCPYRKFSMDYALTEFMFYLGNDRGVGSMPEFAKIWGDIQDESGEIESNYGCYIFGHMWLNTLMELVGNHETRRAVIPILSQEHIGKNDKDYPCTSNVQFYIRDGKLSLSWNMRSQDAIFGMANDFFAAGMFLQMMLNHLNRYDDSIKLGTVTFNVVSYHIYERHFELLKSPFHIGGGRKVRINMGTELKQYGINRDHSKEEVLDRLDKFKKTGVHLS